MNVFLFTISLIISTSSYAAINCLVDDKNEFSDIIKIVRTTPEGDRHCTGTLLKGGCHILTAGHCVVTNKVKATPTSFQLKSGVNSEVNLGSVSDVSLHPDYVQFKKNDVAILTLSKCISGGLEIDYGPVVAGSEISVGGYGVTRLNSFISQNTRHMGKNRIYSFDGTRICLKEIMFNEDGKVPAKESQCFPAGQDSGSPAIQNNKIKGVFVSSSQVWLKGGKTKEKSCFENIQKPEIRSFIERTTMAPMNFQIPASNSVK